MANFVESPRYGEPIRLLDDEEIYRFELPGFYISTKILNLAGVYGPTMHRKLIWPGQITDAYI